MPLAARPRHSAARDPAGPLSSCGTLPSLQPLPRLTNRAGCPLPAYPGCRLSAAQLRAHPGRQGYQRAHGTARTAQCECVRAVPRASSHPRAGAGAVLVVPCLKQRIRTGYLRGIWSNGAAPAPCWGKESSGSTRAMSATHVGAGGPKPAPRHAVLEPSLAPQCHHPLCKEIQRVAASLVQPAAPRMASDAPQSTVAPWHRAPWAQPPGVPALLGAARRRRGAGASFLGTDPSKRMSRKSCGHHRAWLSVHQFCSPHSCSERGFFPALEARLGQRVGCSPAMCRTGSALPGPADTQHKALIRPGLCMLISMISGPPPLYQAPEWAHCLRAEHSSYRAPANGSPGAT